MTPDPKRSKETVKQGETRESNALPGESPERKEVRFLPDSGDGGVAMSMARDRCSRDSIARWSPTWILSTLKLHRIVCWKMELCKTFQELKVLA